MRSLGWAGIGAALACALSGSALAATNCLSEQDADALHIASIEQQLTVAQAACHNAATERYSLFKLRYSSDLKDSDAALIAFFTRHDARAGAADFRTFMAKLSYISSLQVSRAPESFCRSAAETLQGALSASSLSQFAATQPVDFAMPVVTCPKPVVTAQAPPAPRVASLVGRPVMPTPAPHVAPLVGHPVLPPSPAPRVAAVARPVAAPPPAPIPAKPVLHERVAASAPPAPHIEQAPIVPMAKPEIDDAPPRLALRDDSTPTPAHREKARPVTVEAPIVPMAKPEIPVAHLAVARVEEDAPTPAPKPQEFRLAEIAPPPARAERQGFATAEHAHAKVMRAPVAPVSKPVAVAQNPRHRKDVAVASNPLTDFAAMLARLSVPDAAAATPVHATAPAGNDKTRNAQQPARLAAAAPSTQAHPVQTNNSAVAKTAFGPQVASVAPPQRKDYDNENDNAQNGNARDGWNDDSRSDDRNDDAAQNDDRSYAQDAPPQQPRYANPHRNWRAWQNWQRRCADAPLWYEPCQRRLTYRNWSDAYGRADQRPSYDTGRDDGPYEPDVSPDYGGGYGGGGWGPGFR